jgi:hypothetical protein
MITLLEPAEFLFGLEPEVLGRDPLEDKVYELGSI